MAMATNTDTVRAVYEAFSKGDVPTVLGAMDDKIDWQEPTTLPFENQIGPQAVAENIFGVVLSLVDNFTVTAHELVDGGDIVCAIGVYTGTGAKTSIPLHAEFVHVWRFGTDGKITGFRTYTDTALWLEAIGA
jgi:ketosteroid isomerase-like protein